MLKIILLNYDPSNIIINTIRFNYYHPDTKKSTKMKNILKNS